MPLTPIIAVVFAVTCELLLALSSYGPTIQVRAQPGAGFISIDCGGSSSNYTDAETGLSWTSDSTGFGLENVSRAAAINVSLPAKYEWLSSMRIFEGTQSKYCYEFDGIQQLSPYLVRASFWTGDERALFSLPPDNVGQISFQLLINANVWDSIDISLPQKNPLVKEVYVVAVLPTISVCVHAGQGQTAFISSLELRPIRKNFTSVRTFMEAPEYTAPIALFRYARVDFGSATDVRYPDDAYDRIWSADTREGYVVTSTPLTQTTSRTFDTNSNYEQLPSAVLQTALVDNASFNITFNNFSRSYEFFYLVFFAEISDNVSANERVFSEETITATGVLWHSYNLDMATQVDNNNAYYNPALLPVNAGGFLTFSFERNATSSLGPLVNALELLYSSQDNMSLGTNNDDVTTLVSVKRSLGGLDSWGGDPCLPYSYEWLTCNSDERPRITKLSLQNRNITAEIPEVIGELTALVELNLQGNNLIGPIPDSIAQLPNLTNLFLQDNNLSGAIPQALINKKVNLRLAGNPILCKDNNATYCDQQPVQIITKESKKNYMLIVAILAPTCAVLLLLLASIFIFHFRRKDKNDGAVAITHKEVMKYSNLAQHFTSQQIERITNDFMTKLGAGGFGDVFLGTLSTGLNVAVKVSSRRGGTQEGLEFLNEVALLSRVHHKNLVEFVGYCIHPRLVLVYEYMTKGSLEDCLHGLNNKLLSWRDRLKIITGAAQGLEYLHKGCKPPIIHRDVKCSNILFDEDLQGKISDFGISRSKVANTHMTVTNVQGTIGYIAPEYAELQRITEKIDVFAFGVVLLEVVSGRRPFEGSRHITDWVSPLLNQGRIQDIVDPRIGADYNMSCMWKVLEVAIACVEQDTQRRPDMHEVSSELHSALSFELQNETVMLAYDTSDICFDTKNVRTR